MTILFNRKSLTSRRKILRLTMPKAEVILWQYLKDRQIVGYKFRRQYSISKYVVDFYCPRKKLAIEVDGPTHFSLQAMEYDIKRQALIESFGIRVIRVTNTDVYENIRGVINEIQKHLV